MIKDYVTGPHSMNARLFARSLSLALYSYIEMYKNHFVG